jgi:hypothetical protein
MYQYWTYLCKLQRLLFYIRQQTIWLQHIHTIYTWHREANYYALWCTKNSGCQLSRENAIYWTCTHQNSVCHMYVHVQIVYKSFTSLKCLNFTGKLTPWSFMYIIGHNNSLHDVMCIWRVCVLTTFTQYTIICYWICVYTKTSLVYLQY